MFSQIRIILGSLIILAIPLFTCGFPANNHFIDGTSIPSASANIVNPVSEYAKTIGIPEDYMPLLNPLGVDEEMSQSDKEIIETAKIITQLNISDAAKKNNISYITLGKNKEFLDTYNNLKFISEDILLNYLEIGLENIMEYLAFIYDLENKEFADYAIKNKLCIEDNLLTDQEKSFLSEPEKYKDQIFNQIVSEMGKINPDFAREFKELPDFDVAIEIRDIEAVEDMYSLLLRDNCFGTSIDSMLKEGKIDKWIYWGTGQAFFWAARDWEWEQLGRDKPFNEYYPEKTASDKERTWWWRDISLVRFVRFSWEKSYTSNNYQSPQWNDFDNIVGRMNSPDLAVIYTAAVIKYEEEPVGQFVDQPALQTFTLRKGDCEDISMIDAWFINKNGYESYVIKMWNNKSTIGHANGICKKNDSFYMMYDNIRGPYPTIEEAVKSLYPDWIKYKIYDLNWNLISGKTR